MALKRVVAYEGMFLLPSGATADLQGSIDTVEGILKKHGASIIATKKWDERRLAYEIDKQKRGLFVLVYFEIETSQLGLIERDCNLSELVLRYLMIRADHLTKDEMLAADARDAIQTESALRSSEPAEADVG